jgi:Zn-dependent protease with chaperone function
LITGRDLSNAVWRGKGTMTSVPVIDPGVRRRQKIRNAIQGLLLLGAMTTTAGALAWWLFGDQILLWVVLVGVLVGVLRPKVPTRWVLAMYGAQPIPRHAAPQLHRILEILSRRATLPTTPELYYVFTPMANAFAVGRGRQRSPSPMVSCTCSAPAR